MAMSEIERKRRRAEASRRCYLKRKAAMAAQNKAGAKPAKKAVKPVKKVEVRKAKKAVAKPTAAEAKAAKQAKAAEKLLAKLISKGQKPAATAKALVKESAQVVTEVFKTGDQALIEKARAQLEKKLGLVVGDGTVTLSLDKAFKAPKAKAVKAQADVPEAKPAAKKSKDEEEVLDVMAHSRDGLDNVEHTELPVDPAIAAALRDGADPKDAGVPDADEDVQDPDDPDADPEDADEDDREPDDDDDDDDDEEKDPDEEAEEAAEADIEGRRDTLEEFEAQGVGEED